MPSTLPAASAGAELPARPCSFISMVLLAVIAAVPASPAARPTPAAAAIAPWLDHSCLLFSGVVPMRLPDGSRIMLGPAGAAGIFSRPATGISADDQEHY